MARNSRLIIFNSTMQLSGDPVVPAGSRGLMYGDGCFETFRSYYGRFFQLKEHLERLSEGLDYLGIPYPNDLNLKSAKEFIQHLLDRNGFRGEDAVIRIQVWREGSRGYAIGEEREKSSHFVITVSELPDVDSPVSLSTVSVRRIPSDALPSSYKLTNGINYILASTEARQKGSDDALMVTMDGKISETPIANIFWLKGETVFTPSEACDLLPGLTRRVVMELIEKEIPGKKMVTGRWQLSELLEAETAWICNSVREIVPVTTIDNTSFDVQHPFLEKLQERFTSFRKEQLV